MYQFQRLLLALRRHFCRVFTDFYHRGSPARGGNLHRLRPTSGCAPCGCCHPRDGSDPSWHFRRFWNVDAV